MSVPTFGTALANANYACVASGSDPNKIAIFTVVTQTTTYVDIVTNRRGDGNNIDVSILNIVIFGSNVPAAAGGSNVAVPTGGVGGGTIGWGIYP